MPTGGATLVRRAAYQLRDPFRLRTLLIRFHLVRRLLGSLIAISPSVSAQASNQCGTTGFAVAADLAEHVDAAFLEKMRSIEVKTIFRYYDHPNETLPGKTLHRAEKDLILKYGFSLGVVFQHWNDRFTSFTVERGRIDAERSLALARENGQSENSAIYFGVDGGWESNTEVAAIKGYFSAASPLVTDGGFRIGVYGSGRICKEIISSGLASICWLANATGWPDYRSYYSSNAWSLAQQVPVDCVGKQVDFNIGNPAIRNPDMMDYGQFGGRE
jgi:Domain of unknown function (DUF1906)